MRLNTYQATFTVTATVTVKVRARDKANAKPRAQEQFSQILENIERHYSRVVFAKAGNRTALELLVDGAEANREYGRQHRARQQKED